MTDFIYVEPAHAQRPAFALWCLSQTPKIMTSSATGFDVPLDLYPTIPTELLDGAYVDGYLYNRPEPRPSVRTTAGTTRKPRKRAAKKVAAGAYTRKPSMVEATLFPAADVVTEDPAMSSGGSE